MAKIYNASESLIEDIAETDLPIENKTAIFFERFGINIKEYDINDINIKCLHITNSIDNNYSLNKFGLVSLKKQLMGEYPLGSFLRKNGIIIDLEKRKILVNGSEKDIANYNNLHSKLYYDCGELEAFWQGQKNAMENYSGIRYYPEILSTIDYYLETNLKTKWKELGQGFEWVSFYVRLVDTTYINGMLDDSDLGNYKKILDGQKTHLNNYSDNVFYNIWLVSNCFYYLYCDDDDYMTLGINSDNVIKPSKLKIYSSEEDWNLVKND